MPKLKKKLLKQLINSIKIENIKIKFSESINKNLVYFIV